MSRFIVISGRSLAVVVGLALAGCASTPPFGQSPEIQVVDAAELPPPGPGYGSAGQPEYVIGPGDELAINVFGAEDFDIDRARVDAAGRVSIPLVGSVAVGGLTPADAEAEIGSRLKANFFRDPRVSVNVTEVVSRQVTIAGQVVRPGSYPVVGTTSLIRAVAQAQGLNDYAKMEDVVVFRTVGDKRMAALYNLRAIERGNYPDPSIYPEDVVVVGDSPSRRMFENFLRGASILASPIVVLVQQL